MKDIHDIQDRCMEELNRTYRERCMSPGNHYLWYCESTEMNPGNIAIATDQPFSGWMIADKVRDNLTNEGNITYWLLHRVLSRLPVLEV